MRSSFIIVMVFSCLVFLVAAVGIERYRKPIGTLPAGKFPFLRKAPWDIILKGLVAAGFILFSKRVLYFIGIPGVVQTPASVWQVDMKLLAFLCFMFFLALFLMLVGEEKYLSYLFSKLSIKEEAPGPGKSTRLKKRAFIKKGADKTDYNSILIVFIIFFIIGILATIPGDYHDILLYIWFLPPLLLKMLCSGKYVGLVTSFLFGCYCVDIYKKLKPGITPETAKFLKAPAVIIMLAWLVGFFYFTGNWEARFRDKILSAQSEAAVEELLDAVHSITDSRSKATALGQILRADIPWNREILRQAVDETMTIKSDKEKAMFLRDLAYIIARTGDRKWAGEVARGIPDEEIRNAALQELQVKPGKIP